MYAKCAPLIHSLFLFFTVVGASNDYRVIENPPFQITSAGNADVSLIIESDNVALEDDETFNVTLEIISRFGTGIPQFDGTARNEFLCPLQVFIEDRTGEWTDVCV